MPYEPLTEEQREIRDLVRQLARERIAPRAAEIDESHEFPWDVVELYRENDLFGLFFDEQYGGLGTGTLLSLVAIEEVSKVCATSGLILAVQELGSLGLKLAGDDEQKTRYLPRLASGEWLCAYALTESGSGSDSAAMRSSARREGDEYVLNGSKRFITNAGVAQLYTVFAKTDPEAGHSGISAFVVEADTPGFEVARVEPKMGIKGSTTGELVFEEARVPAGNLLGAEGDGFKIAMRILDRSRPGVAAQGLGLAQGATDYALEYAKTRETMGRPIAQHQLVAAMLADMETKCEAARGLLYKFGAAVDEGIDGSELTKLSAMTKLYCTDVAMEVTTDAVQVLGGYGYISEYPLERMMRDAKITQIYEGTNQIQRLVIAREMLKEQRAFLLAGVSGRLVAPVLGGAMKRYIGPLILLAALAALVVVGTAGASHQVKSPVKGSFRYCSDPTFPPMESTTTAGKTDRLRRRHGERDRASTGRSRRTFVQTAFPGLLPALDAKKCNVVISGIFITPDRVKQLPRGVVHEDAPRARRAGGEPEEDQGPERPLGQARRRAGGHEVRGVPQGAERPVQVVGRPQFTLQSYPGDTDAVAQLMIGRADAVLTQDTSGAYQKQAASGQARDRLPVPGDGLVRDLLPQVGQARWAPRSTHGDQDS